MNKRAMFGTLVMLAVAAGSLFAWSLKKEKIYIKNNLGTTFTIHVEFVHTQRTENTIGQLTNWEQPLAGFNICDFYSLFAPVQTKTYKVDANVLVVKYLPVHLTAMEISLGDRWEVLLETPFEEKLKEIFKVFTITDEDGTVLLTLDTISKAKVELNENISQYTIILDESLYE